MDLIYCAVCGKMIPPGGADEGRHFLRNGGPVCPQCYKRLPPGQHSGATVEVSEPVRDRPLLPPKRETPATTPMSVLRPDHGSRPMSAARRSGERRMPSGRAAAISGGSGRLVMAVVAVLVLAAAAVGLLVLRTRSVPAPAPSPSSAPATVMPQTPIKPAAGTVPPAPASEARPTSAPASGPEPKPEPEAALPSDPKATPVPAEPPTKVLSPSVAPDSAVAVLVSHTATGEFVLAPAGSPDCMRKGALTAKGAKTVFLKFPAELEGQARTFGPWYGPGPVDDLFRIKVLKPCTVYLLGGSGSDGNWGSGRWEPLKEVGVMQEPATGKTNPVRIWKSTAEPGELRIARDKYNYMINLVFVPGAATGK